MTTLAIAENLSELPLEAAFEPDEDVIKLMAEIGLSAAVRGCGDAAAPIFEALAMFRPDNPLAAIGKALGEIAAGRSEEAIAGLRRAGVNQDSCPDELRAVLLIALCLAGHHLDASLLCRRLLNSGEGPTRNIALRLKPVIDAGLGKA
ncbi:MAG: hypothetical protein AAFO01_12165 [Pseudomonadota bacterium]